MHWGPVSQTRFGGGLGCIWPHAFSSVYANVFWAKLKERLLNWHPLRKWKYVLICWLWKMHRNIWVRQTSWAIYFAWNMPSNIPSLYCFHFFSGVVWLFHEVAKLRLKLVFWKYLSCHRNSLEWMLCLGWYYHTVGDVSVLTPAHWLSGALCSAVAWQCVGGMEVPDYCR